MDLESDEEVHSEQEDAASNVSGRISQSSSIEGPASPNEVEGPASPVDVGPGSPNDEGPASPIEDEPSSPIDEPPYSPMDEGPASPDNNGPESPDVEPGSPDNEGPTSPDQEAVSPTSICPASPDGPPSPAGSIDPHHSDGEDKAQSDDEEVVREDVESGDEDGNASDNEEDKEKQSQAGDDEVERASIASEGANSQHSNQGDLENDDGASVHSEIEERASIHSDDEDEADLNKSKDDEAIDNLEEDAKPPGTSSENSEKTKTTKDDESNSDDDSDDDSKVGELIADIFGESDEEEFEGFGEEDLVAAKKRKEKKKQKVLSDSEDENDQQPSSNRIDGDEKGAEDGNDQDAATGELESENAQSKKKDQESDDDDDEIEGENRHNMVYDFDLMMQKKRDESGRRKKKRGYDIINDSDDLIADLLAQMKQAADEDRILNKNRTAATKKLRLLPVVSSQLKKSDLKEAFLDQGVLSVMTDWLTPLPDRSLPHLQIRECMLKLLGEFPPVDQSLLKNSGIGRAVMYLYKHPKESRDNREKAGRLISEWSRPIFNLNTNFRSMTKEERERRDFDHMPKKRKERLEAGDEPGNEDINSALTGDDKSLKPGEKGWIGRARVPMPSTRDYVVRPKWNVETEFSPRVKKQLTRMDKHIRSIKEKKRLGKVQRAVTISIEGRKMSL